MRFVADMSISNNLIIVCLTTHPFNNEQDFSRIHRGVRLVCGKIPCPHCIWLHYFESLAFQNISRFSIMKHVSNFQHGPIFVVRCFEQEIDHLLWRPD